MRKKRIRIAVLLMTILLISISIIITKVSKTDKVVSLEDLMDKEELSDEFMDDYFEGVAELNEINNKENILIVSSINEIKDDYGATKIVAAPNHQYILQYDTEEQKNYALTKYRKDDSIFSVEENQIYELNELTYDSWAVESNAFDDAIKAAIGKDLNEVVVAIIDTGCKVELFNEKYPDRLIKTYNVLDKSSDVEDKWTHGTFIAGQIAESTPPNVKIMPIKIMHAAKNEETGEIEMFGGGIVEVQAAIDYAMEQDADVIVMSFGGKYSGAVDLTLMSAIDSGIIAVSANGNDNWGEAQYPAAHTGVLAVSAVDSHFEKTDFTNYGAWTAFAAPGYKVGSLTYAERPKYRNGTSFSAPYVASAVAILKSYNKDLKLDEVIELLKKHAIDIGDDGRDKYYGYGVVSFKNAEFCSEDVVCDKYGVFKESAISTYQTVKIVSNGDFSPEYNYGNITNIMNAEIKLYYTEEDYYTKTLGQLIDDIDIIGYEPYSFIEQVVKIKYKDLETTINIDNRKMKNGWNYEELSDGTVKLTGINYSETTLDVTYAYSPYPTIIYIPETIDGKKITVLGENIFTDMILLKRVTIPYGVKRIENNAFSRSTLPPDDLEHSSLEVIFPNSIEYIAENAFENRRDYEVALRVFKGSASYAYAINHEYEYSYPETLKINIDKSDYKAFEKLPNNFTIDIIYGGTEQINETITKGYVIKYNNGNDSFRYGDTSAVINFRTKLGYSIDGRFPVKIEKAMPQYDVPTSLSAREGQKLSEIELPEGFEWMDSEQVIESAGTQNFKAKYIPADSINYEIVENIDILVIVFETDNAIENNTKDYVGIYDGNEHTIDVAFSISDYTIKYSVNNFNYDLTEIPKFTEVGEYVINYKVECTTCDDLVGSNKVKIYGIEEVSEEIKVKNNVLLVTDQINSFATISERIKVFAPTYTYLHYSQNGELIDSDIVKTGDRIEVKIDNSSIAKYDIAILGDVTGDGLVNIADVIKIADHSIEQNILIHDYEKYAAEVTGDDNINIADVIKIADYTLDNSIELWR